MPRRKISTTYVAFVAEIDRQIRLDAQSRRNAAPGIGRPPINTISKRQLESISEGIFVRAIRSYEMFVRDLFILYSLGKSNLSGRVAKTFLQPRNYKHAEEIFKGDQLFTNWTSPSVLISRSDRFLGRQNSFRTAVVNSTSTLEEIKRIRNFVAHSGGEAETTFKIELRKHHGTVPIKTPPAGKFLSYNCRHDPTKTYLLYYLEFLKEFANKAAT